MRKLLLQLDADRLPSAFDRIVALDAGADDVLSYGGVAEADVQGLVHGAIFTRGPKELASTALFVGGSSVPVAEGLLEAAKRAFFGPFRVSLMLDANGCNTTAAAAVAKLLSAVGGEARGRRTLVVAGTGPVGLRAAGLLARLGAEVTITSREEARGAAAARSIATRFGGHVGSVVARDSGEAGAHMASAELVLCAGPAGVRMVGREAWASRSGLRAIADVNAVPPAGVEGVEAVDNGAERDGVACFGALGIGGRKMKAHKAAIARLFEKNDLVLDAEEIYDLTVGL
jgi:hypothetical protein